MPRKCTSDFWQSKPVPGEAELFEQWRPALDRFFRAAKKKWGRHFADDDLYSRLSFEMLRAIRSYNPKRGAFSTHLWTVLKRTIFRAGERRLDETPWLVKDEAVSPLAFGESAIDMGPVQRAMKFLDKRERRIIRMFYFERRSLKEIGAKLEITKEHVHMIKARALKILREELKSQGMDTIQDYLEPKSDV